MIDIKYLINTISRMKLRQKMMISTSLLLILSTFFSVILLYNQSKTMIEENSYNETKQVVTQLANYYDEKLAKMITIAHMVIGDASFNKSLNNIIWNESYNYAKEESVMQDLFQRGMMRDRMISSMMLYTPNGVFHDNLHTPLNLEELKTGSYFEDLPMRHNVFWGQAQTDKIFKGEEKVIPIIFNIEVSGYYDKVYFVINISERAVMSRLQEVSTMNNTNVYLFNKDGKTVTKSEDEDFLKDIDIQSLDVYKNKNGHLKYKNNNQELYVNYATIGLNQWKVVSIQSYFELMKKVNTLQKFALTIGGILILISISLAYILASTVTSPLKRLKKTMEKVKGGSLETRFIRTSDDEIGELGRSFNSMLDRIENLIKELEIEKERTKLEQAQKVRAEIKVLQAQINPHFLYNTLDTIYWKSLVSDNKLVGDMIISLSDMLRIGLGKGKDIVTVKEEIEHVKNYLYLQSNVYKDKFDYTIDASTDVLEFKVVKILLQPLVENSILHGFNNINYKGRIEIKAVKIEDSIEFIVKDNGCGFDVKKEKDKGFALGNIYDRIQLYYDGEGKMEFFSIPYEQTTIKIIIPIENKRREDDV